MSKLKRILSALMSGVMLAASGIVLPFNASADDNTNLVIDWDYEKTHNITSPSEALADMASQQSPAVYQKNKNWLKDNYNELRWTHVKSWNTHSEDYKPVSIDADWKDSYSIEQPLRDALADDSVKYIALYDDDEHQVHARGDWEPMMITSDKVLDLNGHTLNIRYDMNVNNNKSNLKQKDRKEVLNCTAFEINRGATLTIIDSSEWRGEGDGGKGTGTIKFSAYMVNPYEHDINHYTTRDLFHVSNGNLVIYGGTFQAGRAKTQVDDGFKLSKLKSVIGSVVHLGVSVAEYATGINAAKGTYNDVHSALKDALDTEAAKPQPKTGEDDGKDDKAAIAKRDGTNDTDTKVAGAETKENMPSEKESREQTVDEKKKEQNRKVADGEKPGEQENENKANANQNAKDDKYAKVAAAENEIVKAAADKDKIGDIVDGCFQLVDEFIDLLGMKGDYARVSQSFLGTVVRVGTLGSFVAYGGTFKGFGSTPNTRNAVVEVEVNTKTRQTWDTNKYLGGLAYIYGGTFEAYTGANIFNMVRSNSNIEVAQRIRDQYGNISAEVKVLKPEETNGIQVLYYENQDDVADPTKNVEPIPINTGNIQVRGGLFRCSYDAINLAIKEEGDSEHFRIFPGTTGSVNLGVNSFNSQLIQDGRIQIDDIYGVGSLVLLDDRADETEPESGLYHYRLYCGDTELRYKTYLTVYPNNDAAVSASRSMQLTTYYDNEIRETSQIFTNEGGNIRAPYAETEYYFDYVVDNGVAEHYNLRPHFFNAATSSMIDWKGESITNSEVWYYPTPMSRKIDNKQPVPVPDVRIGDEILKTEEEYDGDCTYKTQRDLKNDEDWYKEIKNNYWSAVDVLSNESIRTNMKYFTYKVYRVDPLTRDNISESEHFKVDEPLLQVSYGASDDCLKCMVPLKQLEQRIAQKKGDADWKFSAGEMYRIVLEVEEHVGIGYRMNSLDASSYRFNPSFADTLETAKTKSSILIRCCSQNDNKDMGNDYVKEKDFTPLRITNATVVKERNDAGYLDNVYTIEPGAVAEVKLVNGKAGMVDFGADGKIFDLYYQWIEVDKNGNPINIVSDDNLDENVYQSMFAGMNNIYDREKSKTVKRSDFIPSNFITEQDQKIYRNCPDIFDDSTASYRNNANGLPSSRDDWTSEMLHWYSHQHYEIDKLKKDPTEKFLTLENNNVFATNTDTSFIPFDMNDRYFRVRAIAINLKWYKIFDEQQIFWSPVVHVKDQGDSPVARIFGRADSTGPISQLNQFNMKLTINQLKANEQITSITYTAEGGDKPRTVTLTSNEQIKYPDSFLTDEEKADLGSIRFSGVIKLSAKATTNYNRTMTTDTRTAYVSCVAESFEVLDNPTFDITDVRNGVYDDGYQLIQPVPRNADYGFDPIVTYEQQRLCTMDQTGKIYFNPGCGTGKALLKVRLNSNTPTAQAEYIYVNVKTSKIAHKLGFKKVEAKDPTYTEDGCIEHWKCDHCGRITLDADGTVIVSESSVIIPKKELTVSVPKIVTAKEGEEAVFTASASQPEATYQWQYLSNGRWMNSTWSTAQTNTLRITATAARSGQQYRCVVTDQGYTAYSDCAMLCIEPNYEDMVYQIGEQIKLQANAYYVKDDESIDVINTFPEPEGTLELEQYSTKHGQYFFIVNYGGAIRNENYLYMSSEDMGTPWGIAITEGYGIYDAPYRFTLLFEEPAYAPTITEHPQDVEDIVGKTAIFSVTAKGKDLTYQWQFNAGGDWQNSGMTGAKTATLSVPITEARNHQEYRCIVTSGGKLSVASRSAWIQVTGVPPVVAAQPQDYTGKVGDVAKFTVSATGTGTLSYQWQFLSTSGWQNSGMTGSQTATLSVPVTEARNGQQYRCVVTDSTGLSTTSNAAKIIVNAATLTITAQPKDYTGNVGDTAKFTVSATGTGTLSYQWQFLSTSGWQNSGMTGSQTATLSVPVTEARNGQQYRCVVKSSNGLSVTSNAAKIIVNASALTITAQPKDYTGNVGDTAKFTVSATGTGTLSYQWQFLDNGAWKNSGMDGAKTNTLNVGVTDARNGQQYRCVVKSSNGTSVTSNAAKITVKANPLTITVQPKDYTGAINETAKFTVTASGTNLTYQWQFLDNGAWKNSGMNGAKTNTLSVQVTAARNGQQYRCVVSSNGTSVNSNPAKIIVAASALAISAQPSNYTGAVGETAKFTVSATGTSLSYQWQYLDKADNKWKNSGLTGALTNTLTVPVTAARDGLQFQCIVKSSNGSSVTSNTAKLTVKPTITAQPKDYSGAVGTTAKFTVTASGTSLSYQWQFLSTSGWKDSGMDGAKTSTLSVPITEARNGQKYRCVVKSANGTSVTSNAAALNVTAGITGQPESVSAPVGETAQFTVTAPNNATYQWQFLSTAGWKDSGMTGAKTATISVPVTEARDGQKYRCIVKLANGTTVTSDEVTLTVQAAITAQPQNFTAKAGETAKFTVSASGTGLTYQWQFLSTSGWQNSGMDGAKTATISVPVTAARNGQQYRCVVTSANGTTEISNAAKLTVNG